MRGVPLAEQSDGEVGGDASAAVLRSSRPGASAFAEQAFADALASRPATAPAPQPLAPALPQQPSGAQGAAHAGAGAAGGGCSSSAPVAARSGVTFSSAASVVDQAVPSKEALVQRARRSNVPGFRAVYDAVRARERSYPHHAVSDESQHASGRALNDIVSVPKAAPPRLFCLVKLAYALPEFSKLSVTMLMNVHAIAFFNEFGAHLSVLTFFISLARSFDVLTDPLMGWVSDATRSRFGRRRPYMLAFAPGYAGCLIGLLSVVPVMRDLADPAARSARVVSWFGCFYVTFYLFDTGSNVPHAALGPELTDSPTERNATFFLAALFKMAGILFAAMAPVALEYEYGCHEEAAAAAPGAWPTCTMEAKGYGLQLTACALALWYILAIGIVCCTVRERPASTKTHTPPLVPSLMATFRNKPFMALLPAWVLDQLSVTMLTTMLVYFYTYIVQPEKTVECAAECTLDAAGARWYDAYPERDARGRSTKSIVFPGCRSTFWCGTSGWIGLSVVALITGAVLSQPAWLWLTTKLDKRNVWLLMNLVNALTNIVFVLVGEGDPVLCVTLVFFNGLPLGAQFLNDSLVADVIDYDEFLTGVRSEGRFTIGQSLLPKVVSVPAATVPLTLLVFLGFTPPDELGRPQPQTATIRLFIRVVFFGIPFVCCLISVALKVRFPLKTEAIRRQVREGCALHMQGLPAVDPLTERVTYPLDLADGEEVEQWRLDHFFLRQLEHLYMRGPKPLIRSMRANRLSAATALVGSVAICSVGLSRGWIYEQALAWLCIFSAMGGGLSLCMLLLAQARLRAAYSLQFRPVNKAFLGRLISLYQGDTNVESLSGVTIEHVDAALERWKVTNAVRGVRVRVGEQDDVPLLELMEALQGALRGIELPVVDAESATARATRQMATTSNAAVIKRVVDQQGGGAPGAPAPGAAPSCGGANGGSMSPTPPPPLEPPPAPPGPPPEPPGAPSGLEMAAGLPPAATDPGAGGNGAGTAGGGSVSRV